MNEKVTVAIPVYNGEKFILETLKSILNQTRKVDHILICDNQSTDNTLKIVRKIKNKHPDIEFQIHINKKNIGYPKNYNTCLTLCNTDFLLIISSDDLLRPDTIEKQLRFFKMHPDLAVVGGQYSVIDENGKFLRKIIKTNQTFIFKKGEILEFIEKTASWLPQSLALMKMKYIRKVGEFDYQYLGFDELYWPRVLQYYSIAMLKDILLDLRSHKEQDGSLAYINKSKEVIKYLEERKKIAEFENETIRNRKIKKILKKQIANSSIMMGNKSWKDYRKYILAIKYWKYALVQDPNYVIKKHLFKMIVFFLRPVKSIFK